MSGSEKLSETQRAKAAFRESEEQYRALADAATDAIITIDSNSTILIVNPAAERIFGYSTKELIGQPLTMLMPEYLRHLHKAGITRYLETDCAVLHLWLPRLSGLELQRKLATDGQNIPTIIITAQGDDKTRAEAMAGGAIAFLQKPEEVLLAAIARL